MGRAAGLTAISCFLATLAELAERNFRRMSRERHDAGWSLRFRRLLADLARARRSASRLGRGLHGAGCPPVIDYLERRTLLAVSAFVGPVAAPTSTPEQTTLNLQLEGKSSQALSQLMPLITAAGATVAPTSVTGLYTVEATAASLGQLAADFSANPAVAYAQPVQTFQVQTAPNDPLYVAGDQWQLNGTWGVNAPAAWSVTTGSNQVIVADVDTGLNYNLADIYDNVWLNQPEIPASVIGNLTDTNADGLITFTDLNNPVNQGPGKIEDTNSDGIITGLDVLASTSVGGWVNPTSASTQDGDTASPDDLIGWNYVSNTNNPMDDEGHGTFTAGEIGEMTNNATGGAGLVWNTQIMPVKFLDSTGSGTDTAAAQAIDYAVDHGAKVINASWGGTGTDTTIEAAIEYADEHDVIIVAAAGNSSADDDTTFFSPASYAAQYPNVIAVAAITSTGALASYSNYGTGSVELAAPGSNVYSVLSNGSYGTMSGTSMAAPMVTGTIALVEAAHPSWSMSQVIDAVLDTVTPDPALSGKVTTGGVVNAGAAVANTAGPYVVSPTSGGTVTSGTGFSSLQLTFNEEINPATFTPNQVTLSGPGGVIPTNEISVTVVSGSNDHEYQISFPAQNTTGNYNLTVGPDIQDWYGNDMNQNHNGVNGEPTDSFTATIEVQATAAQSFKLSGFPTNPIAGTPYNVTVTAYDAFGNVATGYTGKVVLSSSDAHAVLPAAAYTFTGADAGSHTFSITLETAGAQSITATDTITSSIMGSDTNIVVQAAAATTLAVTGFPSPVTAGVAGNVVVTAYDAYGNVATGYTGSVALSTSDGRAVLPGSYAFMSGDAGSHTFSVTLETAGTYLITATDTGNSSIKGSESSIVVQAATAQTFSVTGFPANPVAGTAYNVKVTAYDAYNNVATGYTGKVALSSSDGHAVLPSSYIFTTTDAGSHTFSVTLETAGAQTITATDTVTSSLTGSQSGITVQAAAAQSLVLSGFPANPVAGSAFNVKVTAYDAYNNVATGYTGKVALSSSDGHAILPSSAYTFSSTDAGSHTFSVTLETAGKQSITATDTTTSSITGSAPNIIVQAATAKTLAVTGFPTNPIAGTAYNLTVTAFDAYGNVATGYTGKVALSSSDSHAVLPGSYTFISSDAGTHSFSVTLKTAATQSITATDTTTSGITGSQSNIAVQAAAAKTLAVTAFPTNPTAGTAYNVRITAFDAYNNVATGYTGTVALSSSDSHAVLPGSYTFTSGDAGTHLLSVTLQTAGTQSITATDTVAPGITGSELNIAVQPITAKTLVLTGFPTNPTAGVAYNVTVTAYDSFNNVATGYFGTVALTSSDGHALLPAGYTFTSANAGVHTFSVTLTTAGAQSITATDATTSSITGSDSNIVVQAAAAKTLAVTAFPTNPTAGTAYNVKVTAFDAFNNVAIGYTGTVALSSSDGHAVLPGSYAFTGGDAGSHTFSVTLETSGAQSITATDTSSAGISGSETGITVQAAAAQSLALSGFPTNPTAGTAYNLKVTAFDAYHNLATGYSGTVALSSSDGHAVLPAGYAFTGGDAGSHTFSVTLETAGAQSITVTDSTTPSITGSDSNIIVQAAAAKTLTVTGFPATDTAGAAGNVLVTAFDAYGNVATGYTGRVAISSSDNDAILPANYTFTSADHGLHSFSVTLDTSGTQSISAADTVAKSLLASENGITVQAAGAQSFQLTGFPTNPTAGTAYNLTVTAFDAYNNIATGYTGTVALSSSDAHAVLPAEYTFESTDAGSHVFSLTLETAGPQSLAAADTTAPEIKGSVANIAVQAASAKTLTVTGFPKPVTAGAAGQVVVTAFDAYGNVASGYRGSVGLSSSDGHALLPPIYTFTGADAGTHHFSVTLETAGAQSITATDTIATTLTASENSITVQAAAAKTLAVTGFPTNPTAGTAYNFTVTAFDAYNNVATGYTGTVALSSSDSHAILPAGYTFLGSDAGSHTFSVTLETAGPQSITAADTGNGGLSASRTGIAVQAAAAHSFTVAGFPTNPTAGTAYNVTVTAFDAFDNIATGYTGNAVFSSSDGHAVLPPNGYTFTGADGGSHTFSVALETAGSQSITVTDATTSSITGSQSNIVVQAAAAKTLTVAGFPTNPTAGTAYNVVISAYDAYGNVATGYRGSVKLSSTDGHALLPAAYTFTSADAGTHSLSVTLLTAGPQSITATDKVTTSLTASDNAIKVQAATARTLTVTGFPSNPIAGTVNLVTVTAFDAYGNVATGYTGTVALSSSDSHAGLPGDYTFAGGDAGTQTFSIVLETAGTQSITVTDTTTPSITGTQLHIVVQAAMAQTLAVTGVPSTVTAGAANPVVVTAYDAYGNVATGYAGIVALTSSDGHAVVPADYTFTSSDAGSHTFSLTLETAGPQSIAATDTVEHFLSASDDSILVLAAAAKTLSVSGIPTTDTAGTVNSVTVTAYDAFGNVADGYRGTVELTSSDQHASLPGEFTFTAADAGAHIVSVALDTAGTQTITATDSVATSSAGSETGISVRPAAAESLKVTGFPTTATAGTASSVVVTAFDAYGNVATGYTGTVALSSSDDHAVLPASLAFTGVFAGTHVFPVTLTTAGTQSITARDLTNGTVDGTESGIVVNPAAASVLVLSSATSATAGVAQNLTVTAQDAYGNTATGYAGTVRFESTDHQATAGAEHQRGPHSQPGQAKTTACTPSAPRSRRREPSRSRRWMRLPAVSREQRPASS